MKYEQPSLEQIKKEQSENPLSPSGKKRELPVIEGGLSEEQAHDKANMMRADLGVKDGKIEKTEYKTLWGGTIDKRVTEVPTTKEDYEKALQGIEDLEKLASEETKGDERIFKLKKILQRGGHSLQKIFFSVGLIPEIFIASVAYTDEKDRNEPIESYKKMLDHFKMNESKFMDAKTKLKDLIEKGDKFGKEELRNNEEETV